MNKILIMLSGSMFVVLTGCSMSVPVTGVIGDETAQGQATASSDGSGTFSVATIEGLSCNGTYDSLDRAPTISAPVVCNDGRTGNLLVTRTLDGVSGTVVGKLSDGTRGQFVFGNLTFEQAFGLGNARIKN